MVSSVALHSRSDVDERVLANPVGRIHDFPGGRFEDRLDLLANVFVLDGETTRGVRRDRDDPDDTIQLAVGVFNRESVNVHLYFLHPSGENKADGSRLRMGVGRWPLLSEGFQFTLQFLFRLEDAIRQRVSVGDFDAPFVGNRLEQLENVVAVILAKQVAVFNFLSGQCER